MGKILAFLLIISCSSVYASERATCKVLSYSTTLSVGSGTFISKIGNKYQILTCGHVVHKALLISIELFQDGKRSIQIPAKIKTLSFAEALSVDDLAVLEVNEKDLKGYVPDLIGFSNEVSNGDKVYGFGFPGGRWVQKWEGYIHSVNNECVFTTMIPTPGQSGSAILKLVNGKPKIVGMILWTFHDRGGGSSTMSIFELVN